MKHESTVLIALSLFFDAIEYDEYLLMTLNEIHV